MLLVIIILLAAVVGSAHGAVDNSLSWNGWGNGIYNNRWTSNKAVNKANVQTLTTKCQLTYQFGVSATPTIHGKMVYYPTWNGSFIALDYTTCKPVWTLNVTNIIYSYEIPTAETRRATYQVSRTSPQIDLDNKVLYFGTQTHALLVAADLLTGKVLATQKINTHPFAVITGSPTLWRGRIFVGASSYEEPAPLFFPNYTCCNFIGNMASLTFNKATKKFTTKWSIPTLPSGEGWSGAGVWGSQPSIDDRRNQVFFGTGNVYSFPPEYAHCATKSADCLPPGVNQESIIAIDIPTGITNWVRRVSGMDAWNGACVMSPIDTKNCPAQPPGRDADFGMAPTFVSKKTSDGKLNRDVVVVGQKTATIFAFDAANGDPVWTSDVSRMRGGGISWGIAVDSERVYYTLPYSRFDVPFNTSTSIYGAASLGNGSVLWETRANISVNAVALQPPTVAGDLVLYPRAGIMSTDGGPADYDNSRGALVVLEKKTGAVVMEMELETNFQGGIAVVGDYVFFGTGYRNGVYYLGDGSLYVMKVAGKEKGKGKGNKV